MPWQESSIMDHRVEFVSLASNESANIAELCRRFGISRVTGYKWIARAAAATENPLQDRSRRPHESPSRTGEKIAAAVLALRDEHPAWGGRKLRKRLLTLGKTGVPAASTITEILRRGGKLEGSELQRHSPFIRFERAAPNELWQMDFKGHVPMHIGGRCHPLLVLDDHSRFLLGLRACDNERRETVEAELIEIFRRYGLPQKILCDNGPPWGVPQCMGRHTKLTVWLMRLGVGIGHGRPRHPQTQGKLERLNRTLDVEVLSRQDLRAVAHTQGEFDGWRNVYNLERPSEAIGMRVPAECYKPSERVYPEKLPALEFSPEDKVRKVKHDGALWFQNRAWYIGQAFAGDSVGVRETAKGLLEVRYGPYVVGNFDPASPPEARVPRHPPSPPRRRRS
jgi:transposase InsO family protein